LREIHKQVEFFTPPSRGTTSSPKIFGLFTGLLASVRACGTYYASPTERNEHRARPQKLFIQRVRFIDLDDIVMSEELDLLKSDIEGSEHPSSRLLA
jgi:hypothetical protein